MLGGIKNAMFVQAIGGFLVFPILILLLKWAFPTKKDLVATRAQRIKEVITETSA